MNGGMGVISYLLSRDESPAVQSNVSDSARRRG
jgi:hypothetical protein